MMRRHAISDVAATGTGLFQEDPPMSYLETLVNFEEVEFTALGGEPQDPADAVTKLLGGAA